SLFPSKKAKHTFGGYLFSQKKSLTHKKERWESLGRAATYLDELLDKGASVLPEKLDLVSELRESRTWGAFEKGQPILKVKEQINDQVKAYGYRLELIQKYGYDTKFSSHAVRLGIEGLQIL